jgi:hypothetical protein
MSDILIPQTLCNGGAQLCHIKGVKRLQKETILNLLIPPLLDGFTTTLPSASESKPLPATPREEDQEGEKKDCVCQLTRKGGLDPVPTKESLAWASLITLSISVPDPGTDPYPRIRASD